MRFFAPWRLGEKPFSRASWKAICSEKHELVPLVRRTRTLGRNYRAKLSQRPQRTQRYQSPRGGELSLGQPESFFLCVIKPSALLHRLLSARELGAPCASVVYLGTSLTSHHAPTLPSSTSQTLKSFITGFLDGAVKTIKKKHKKHASLITHRGLPPQGHAPR